MKYLTSWRASGMDFQTRGGGLHMPCWAAVLTTAHSPTLRTNIACTERQPQKQRGLHRSHPPTETARFMLALNPGSGLPLGRVLYEAMLRASGSKWSRLQQSTAAWPQRVRLSARLHACGG